MRLRLHLSATVAEVAFARDAITRLCEHLELGDDVIERIRLAVSEACTNCVLHAYDELDVKAVYVVDCRMDGQALRVTVCDRGRGIHNARPSEHAAARLGLALIEQLADSSDIASRPGGGTRVVMRFAPRA